MRTLLTLHDRGRKLTIKIIQAATTMSMNGHGAAPGFDTASSRTQLANTLSTFITMYEPHEAREDTVGFPAFRQVTSDTVFNRVSQQVAEAQHNRYGDNGFAAFIKQIAGIERQLGIYDLNTFTPGSRPHLKDRRSWNRLPKCPTTG